MAEQGFILRANPTDAMKLYRGSDEVSTGRGASSSRGSECDEDKRKGNKNHRTHQGEIISMKGATLAERLARPRGLGEGRRRGGDAEAARCERVNTRRKHKYRLSLGQATS
jgi:hypothetical protein